MREYDARLRKELIQLVVDVVSSDSDDNDPTTDWLDIKYCHLRNDIPTEQQLFDSLSVKITREVVSLIEPTPENQGRNKGKRCRQRRKQKRKEKQMLEKLQQQQQNETDAVVENESNDATMMAVKEPIDIKDWKESTPAEHLSPEEWNEKLMDLAQQGGHDNAVLLDTRNIYETRVGHFAVPNLTTVFPNTRKFSSLPMALNTEEAAEALAGKQIYMYCTGAHLL